MRLETREEAEETIEESAPDLVALKTVLADRSGGDKPTISLTTGKVMPGKEEVVKKSTEIERVATGIGNLDAEVEGGFIKNSVNLVAGSPGAGKTIFAIQFLMEGIKNGEAALFLSFEETRSSVYKYMATFGWDLEKYEEEKKFFFLRYSPSQVYKLLEEGSGITDSIIRKYGVTRIGIDSITAFTLLYKDELAQREALLALFNLVSGWNCTSILTAEQESDPEKHKPSVIEFEVDSVILLYNFRTQQNTRQRVAEILKMRGTRFMQRIFPMKIEENGIAFYPAEVAF